MNILGCGAAIPIGRHMTTSQLVNVHDKLFLVDCGEGTQVWKNGIKLTNMDNIFISHAHGDHFFGLVPLLSSLNLMLGRTKDINVFVPENLKDILMLMLKELCHIPFNPKKALRRLSEHKRRIKSDVSQLKHDGAMVRSGHIAENTRITDIRPQTVGNEEIVYTPSHVLLACPETV